MVLLFVSVVGLSTFAVLAQIGELAFVACMYRRGGVFCYKLCELCFINLDYTFLLLFCCILLHVSISGLRVCAKKICVRASASGLFWLFLSPPQTLSLLRSWNTRPNPNCLLMSLCGNSSQNSSKRSCCPNNLYVLCICPISIPSENLRDLGLFYT